MSNAARPLAAEREYMRLHRDDHDQRVVAAVNAVRSLDQRIDPTGSAALQVGYTEKFLNPFDARDVSWVHRIAGGKRIIVIVPAELDTTAVASAVEVLVDTALGEREAGLGDG